MTLVHPSLIAKESRQKGGVLCLWGRSKGAGKVRWSCRSSRQIDGMVHHCACTEGSQLLRHRGRLTHRGLTAAAAPRAAGAHGAHSCCSTSQTYRRNSCAASDRSPPGSLPPAASPGSSEAALAAPLSGRSPPAAGVQERRAGHCVKRCSGRSVKKCSAIFACMPLSACRKGPCIVKGLAPTQPAANPAYSQHFQHV